jgi:50S ribosomal protein L16 3-hydroxylase
LEEGDMLYLPPRLPHQGISLSEECITVSMGFRAPHYRSMITSMCELVCNQLDKSDFYQDFEKSFDSDLKDRGKINQQVVKKIQTKIKQQVSRCLDNSTSISVTKIIIS